MKFMKIDIMVCILCMYCHIVILNELPGLYAITYYQVDKRAKMQRCIILE